MNNAKVVITLMSILLLSGALVSAEDAFAVITDPPVITTAPTTTNSTTIAISGTNDSTATSVTVLGGTSDVAATITGTTWTATIPLSSTDGDTNTLTATQTDGTLTSAESDPVIITINNAIPAPVITTAPTTTNSATIAISGTNDSTATSVTVLGGTSDVAATITGTTWTATIPLSSTDGDTNTLTATQTDGTLTSAESDPVIITINNAIPAPVITTAPTTTNSATIAISGTNDSTATSVTVLGGTSDVAATITGTTWTATIPLSSTDGDTNTLTATQTDGTFTSAESDPVIITINNAIPAPVITTAPTTTNSATIAISGTNDSTATSVTVLGGTSDVAATITGTTWTATIPLSSTDGDTNTLTATQTDGTFTSAESDPVIITINNAIPAPVITTAPTTTGSATITLSGTFAESGATISITGGSSGTVTTNVATTGTAPFAWSVSVPLTTSTTTNTLNNLSVTAFDGINTSTPVTVGITTDIIAPTAPSINSFTTPTNTLPTLSGTKESGTTVLITIGTATAVTSTTSTATSWTYDITLLSEGANSISVIATDTAGNTSTVTSSITFDTTPPIKLGTPDLINSSDTGSSSTDNITNDLTPTFTGTGEVGATVTLTATGIADVTNTGIVAVGGTWTIELTVTAGTYSVSATQTDVAGNTSVSSEFLTPVLVDVTHPDAVPLPDLIALSDSGLNTDNITNETILQFTGSAEPGVTVEIFTASSTTSTTPAVSLTNTVTADASGVWTYTTPTLVSGTYAIQGVQTDTAGNVQVDPNVTGSTILYVTVDTLAPGDAGTNGATTVPDLIDSSDTGSSSTDNITNDLTPTFTGTNGDEAGAKLVLTAISPNGVQTITNGLTTVQTDLSWSITSSDIHAVAIEQGNYAFTVHQIDVAGNIQTLLKQTITITLDTLAPGDAGTNGATTVPDLDNSSDTGSSSTDNLTNDTTPTFTGTNGDEAGAKLVLTAISPNNVQTITNGLTTVQTDLSWSITSSELTKTNGILDQGLYTFTVHQIDVAGNIQTLLKQTITITLDTLAPGDAGTNGATTVPDLDNSSDTGSSSTDNLTNDTTPTFTGTNGDGAGAKLVLTAISPNNVQTITNGLTTVQTDLSWSITSSELTKTNGILDQGLYTFTVHQIDVAGNIQTLLKQTITITLDTLAPITIGNIDLDDLSDTGIPTAANYNTDDLTNATAPVFSGTNGDEAGAKLVLTAISPNNVQTITNGLTTVQTDLSWSITSSELTKTNGILDQGLYTFTVHQIDVAGNIQTLGSKTINVTLDTLSPNVGAIGSKSVTEYSTLSFTVTSSDAHTVTYSLTGAPSGASINSSTGEFTWTPIGEFIGTSTITITATDAANNAISETISVVVHKKPGGDSGSKHKTKPTFGIDLKTGRQIIDGGFSFNGVSHDITNNFWTPFAEQEVKVGQTNTFAIKTFAQKQLKIQEFLFGIPQVGDAHKSELDVEIYFNYDGTVESINAVQKSNVVDVDTIKVVTFDSKCASGDVVQRCTTTQLTMMFLEPLQDKVMAIKAVDFKNRYQITYLNDGFDVTGKSLSPMLTQQIAGPEKYEGQVTVTQTAKYSNIWVTEDGREFQTNDSGTFTQINNDTYERTTDSGVVKNRTHSEFVHYKAMQTERVIALLENTCPNCFESFADFEDSWQYDYPEQVDRLEVLKDAIILEQQRATLFLTDAQKYTRSN